EVRRSDLEEADIDESESLVEGLGELFDPARLLGAATFEIHGESTQAGRTAVSVLARPRRRSIEIVEIWGCDSYELAVDRERGVLLKVVGRLGDETAATITVEAIT